ncbi:hypothetical protein ACFY00_04555 [Kitasatospora sp. NPDC001540]|uniref:hypothetical protein n=1 Tax=Kitasatospora sp. NPDC001540 TaxID=3364014 RepID=UPI0036C58745
MTSLPPSASPSSPSSPSSLIDAIRAHEDAAAFLGRSCDFELDRSDHGEPVHLASGARLEGFAKSGAGGTFFFCGEGGEERPVLYADSEGGAALLAVGLPDLLRLLLVAPWWRDCRKHTAEEGRRIAAQYLEDEPDLLAGRDAAAAALGLELPDEGEALSRLRETATVTGRDYRLIFTPEGSAYEDLIG